MAGPSVMVRILADLSGFSKAVSDTGSKGAATADKLHSAFSGVLSTLNKTGILGPFGEAFDGIDQAIDSVSKHAKDVGPAMMGVGGALAGVGVGLTALGSKDQAAHQQLQAAVQATGKDYDDYAKQVDEAIKHQEKFGDTAGTTQDALARLTEATHDPAKALDLLSVSTDLAAAKHEDLGTAATAVGKVYDGNTKLLKQFGIEIDKSTGKTKDGKTATEALAGVLKGQGAAAADTFGGKIAGIKAHVEDVAASMGQKYGPAITAAGTALTGLGAALTTTKAITEAFTGIQKTQAAVTEGVSAAEDVEAASSWAALGPILLIIGAIAALVAIGYVIYRNWSTIWGAIKDAVKAVWDWIKDNWPLLLAIITGPIGIAVLLITKYWDDIRAAAEIAFHAIVAAVEDAVNWIIGAWNTVYATLARIAAAIWAAIAGAFNAIVGVVSGVVGWIIGAWNSLYGAIAGVASRIWGVVSGAFTGLVGVAWSVVGQVIGTFSGIVNWFFGLPGAILRAVGDLGSTLYQAGVAVVQGFINGIGSLAGAVGDKIKSIVTAPINAAKSLLGIGSPSKVFHDIGVAISQGMANGINAGSGLVDAAMTAMVPGAGPTAVGYATAGSGTAAGGPGMAGTAGPAVVINNAHFATELDVDAFMRRAAWAVQTQRV
jgi:phage-related protein